jgi:ribosomal protein S18 acetylase RimI-like enzyme
MITQTPLLLEHPNLALSSLSKHDPLVTARLTNENAAQVLSFLAERPLHNVVMAGLIRDNGIESNLNRGTFYGCHNAGGILVGVALIGHAIFIDARCDEALRRFAKLARAFPRAHMIMGEKELVERFWRFYAPNREPNHRICREVLFEMDAQPSRCEYVANLRIARLTDISHIMPVHAAMAFEESGVQPLQADPDGFRQRCQRRIEQGRTWILLEEDKLLFKADVISESPEVTYLEGVYVHPEYRARGLGSNCLSQLTSELLERTRSITVLVNEQRPQALRLFRKLGFAARGCYDTHFLRTQPELS